MRARQIVGLIFLAACLGAFVGGFYALARR